MNHSNICSSPVYDIKPQKGSCSHFFGCLLNHLKLLQIQYRAYDRMKQVNCVLHEWLILPDVLLHLQLHLHTRHVTLTDVRGNDNPESLRKCCFMSGAVHLRSRERQWRKNLPLTEYLLRCRHGEMGCLCRFPEATEPCEAGTVTLTFQVTEPVQAG